MENLLQVLKEATLFILTAQLAGWNQRLYDQKVRRSQPLRLIEGISAPDASPHRFKERDGRDFVDLAAEIQ